MGGYNMLYGHLKKENVKNYEGTNYYALSIFHKRESLGSPVLVYV